MLQWPVRIASVVALTVLAYGWGDWFSADRPAVDGVLLGLLTMVLLFALARLYRPGGLAAFDVDDGRAPGEVVMETAPAAVIAPRRERRREKAVRRERERRPKERAPVAPPPEPMAPARERPREAEAAPSPLWAGERQGPNLPATGGALDLNAATADELAMLPGIGRGAAARVVAHREARGPFRSLAELAGVEGFDDARVARVASRLRV